MNKLSIPNKLIYLNFVLIPIVAFLKITIGISAYFIYQLLITIVVIKNINKLNGIKSKTNILLFLFLLFYCSLSLPTYMDYIYNWLGMVFLLLVYSFQWFIIASMNNNWEELLNFMRKRKYVLFIPNIILLLYEYHVGRTMLGNMEISYSILPTAIFSAYDVLKSKSFKNILYFASSTVLIFLVGSRGPLLCIFAFIILYSLLQSKFKVKILISILLIFSAFIVFRTDTLQTFRNTLAEHNIYSRTLDKFLTGSISDDTGRSKIQKIVIEDLNNNLITGTGIGGERIKINFERYDMKKDMSSCYPHNLILEILVHYGMIVGTTIIITIFILSIKAFKKGRSQERDMIIIIFSMEIVRLFISSSYTMSPLFFLYLGLIYSIIKRSGKNEICNNLTQ